MSAEDAARGTAEILLETKSVGFRPEEPFKLASGMMSPTYIDCRRLLSFPEARTRLIDFAVEAIGRSAGLTAYDVIAGGETAGIPFAALIADRLGLPMAYVRKKPKGYGRNARIEGLMAPGQRVLLVEDLATDGGSKLSFVEAIRDTGATCTETLVLFYYGIFPAAEARLAEADLRLISLATWADVLDLARETEAFPAATLDAVAAFLADPEGWTAPV